MTNIAFLMLLFPLIGFLAIGLGGRIFSRFVSGIIGSGTVLASFLIAVATYVGVQNGTVTANQNLWAWADSGPLRISFGLYVDQLSAIMMLVVTGVGFLIHVYSIGYMEDDPGVNRFFAFMNFFILAMSILVLANNFLFLLVGWAGVGLASFLLIGFWYTRPSAVQAARKAFVVNAIGDVGLMLAIFLLVGRSSTLGYAETLYGSGAAHFSVTDGTTTAIALMLLIAAAAKSAQFPLHVWLPDAMEGPTPVSALIHAATMVTAGVYLVARCHVIFEQAPIAGAVLAFMGGFSALYAGTVALFQYDIKRILAYSTMSQLGYMFMAESVGANSAAIFHLVTHAFFKALLFMAAGAVIHALHGEQDIRKMGGLRGQLPVTYWSFLIGALALSAIPPLSGFFSKDGILGAILTYASTTNSAYYALWGVGVFTALLTGFYSFRLIYTVFFGTYRGASNKTGSRTIHNQGIHEVGAVMAVPMAVLLILATVGGVLGFPGRDFLATFLAPAVGSPVDSAIGAPFSQAGNLFWGSLAAGLFAGLAGIAYAWQRYGTVRTLRFDLNKNPLYLFLSNAWYINELYTVAIVRPLVALSHGLYQFIEVWTLDGGTKAIAATVGGTSRAVRRLQSGYARNYALGILAGAVVIVLFFAWQFTR